MNKDEVLKKAQAEHGDEREEQVKDRSLRWVCATMVLFAAAFAYIRGMRGQPVMDLCATVCASVCAGMAYRYCKTKEKSYLWLGIVMLACTVAAAIRFFLGY